MRSHPCHRDVAGIAVVLTVAALAGASVVAQTRAAWTPPLTLDGRPDLEGVWENNSATPLERPAQLAQKPGLTDEELEALKRRAAALFNADADAVFGDTLYLSLLADVATAAWAPPVPTARTGFPIATSSIGPR